jgi:hypothetical protein
MSMEYYLQKAREVWGANPTPKREWVGFTTAERDEIVPMLVQSLINHDDKTMAMLLRAILIDVEERLKEKNGG